MLENIEDKYAGEVDPNDYPDEEAREPEPMNLASQMDDQHALNDEEWIEWWVESVGEKREAGNPSEMADAYMSAKLSEGYNRLVLLQSRLHMLTEVFEGEDFDQDSFISEWITQFEDKE